MSVSMSSNLLTVSSSEQKLPEPRANVGAGSIFSKGAKRIVRDVLRLKRGENLAIEAWEHELPFAKEVAFEARKIGANVVMMIESDDNYFRLVEGGHEKSLGQVGSHEWSLIKNSDAYIFFPGPADLQRQSKLSEKKKGDSTAYNQKWYSLASKTRLRGVRVRTAYATPSRAEMMGFELEKWRANTLDAIDVDYQAIDRVGKKLATLVRKGHIIEVSAPHGTDLHMETSKISPHVYSGVMGVAPRYNVYSSVMNIPGSELDIVPKAGTVQGTVSFDLPVYSGNERIEGLRWTFRNGKLVEYSATNNLELFTKSFKEAKGAKDRVGVLIVGLTPKLMYGFGTQDLTVEGAFTIGIGSFGEGDKNKTSYQFFGTISEATMTVDGRKLIDRGSLVSN